MDESQGEDKAYGHATAKEHGRRKADSAEIGASVPRCGELPPVGVAVGLNVGIPRAHARCAKKATITADCAGKGQLRELGLGNRIRTTAAHALIGSLLNYGLAVTRSAATEDDLQQKNARVLNPAASRIAGVGPTIRRAALYTLADARTMQNHYLLKVANTMDRASRASATRVRRNMVKYLQIQEPSPGTWGSAGERISLIQVTEEKLKWQRRPAEWRLRYGELDRLPEQPVTRSAPAPSDAKALGIFSAHADELRNAPDQERLLFRIDEQIDWRDAAYRVLQTVGW